MTDLDSEPGDRLSDVEILSGKFIALFEYMQEGVALHELVFDANERPVDYRILDVNAQFEQHTGLRRAEVTGQLASAVYSTPEPPYLKEYASVALGGPPLRFEVHFAPLDRHFSISVAPLGPKAFATIFSDITVSKRQAIELEKSRLSQRALLDNQPYLAWLKDRDGRIIFANQACATASGQPTAEALVGKTDLDLWPTKLASAFQEADRFVIQTGVQRAIETQIDGELGPRWFESYCSPVFAPDGSIVGTTGLARDVTEQKRAVQASVQSEHKFEQVFDLAPDPIAVTTLAGDAIYVNRAFCRATGYSREELVGRSTLELGVWKSPEVRAQVVELLNTKGEFDAIEMTMVAKNGERRYMEMSGALIELEGRQVMISAARDVTDHRLAEEKAKAATDTIAQYFTLSLDLLCIATREARFVRLNPAWSELLGYTMTELEQVRFLDLVHPDDLALTLEAMGKLDQAEKIIDFQNRFRHADGSWRWLEWHSVVDGSGLIYAVARDVTRRRDSEDALRAAERAAARNREQLLSVAELAHIGHFTFDFVSGEVHWTPELYRIVGLDPNSCVLDRTTTAGCIHPDDLPMIEVAIAAAAQQRTSSRIYNRVVRPNGEVRYCLSIIEGDVTVAGEARVVGLVQDLTELRRAEAEQRKLEQQVMQSQKLESLGVLAGGIAHDFNNLLTSILGNADLALSELAPTSPACGYLEDIEKVSRRAADLCRQMLAYSGKGRFVVQLLSLNEIVREMAYLLSVSISKKVVIKYNFFPELPSVMADATQMRQVVMNLITNASEAIDEASGVVTLTTGVMDCDEAYLCGVVGDNDPHAEGQYVYLEVSDTGCGMDADTLSRVFDPFFTTKFTGRGLGLAAVLGIVRGHKGALKVYSEKGRGTTFKILLPAHHQPTPAVEVSPDAPSSWQGHGLVLLADDEESIRSMGRHLFERAGFEVVTAADGSEAVELFLLHRQRIRLVVLDMTMPHLDGEACFRELRRADASVKVIMTSGYNEQEVISRFVGKGLAGFVQKPYKAGDILPKVRDVLGE